MGWVIVRLFALSDGVSGQGISDVLEVHHALIVYRINAGDVIIENIIVSNCRLEDIADLSMQGCVSVPCWTSHR